MAFKVQIGAMEFTDANIKEVKFSAAGDDKATSRSNTITNDLIIEGVVLNTLGDKSKDIIEWVNNREPSKYFLNVLVLVTDGDVITRKYHCKSMFFVNYQEVSVTTGEQTKFVITLRQEAAKREEVELTGSYKE